MLAANNVIHINENSVFSDIMVHLDDKEVYSKNTRLAYEESIRQFFKIMRGKEIEHVILNDLIFKRNDIINYRNKLIKDFGYANGTINTKIIAIKGLFENLKANDYDVNPSIFKIKRLKDNPNSYGNLSQTEAERMAHAVFKTEKRKAQIKHLAIMFAIRTSFRLDEILNVKWSDFEYFNGVYKVFTIGKGEKKNTTAISNKMYNQILELKENDHENDKVFKVSSDAITDMMKRLRIELNIPEERNVVFHSFRKVAIDYEFETTGDIKKASLHAGHSSIDTTFKHYLEKNRDYTQTPGVKMDEELSLDFMEEMNVEDFKEFFQHSSHKVKLDLCNYFKNKLN